MKKFVRTALVAMVSAFLLFGATSVAPAQAATAVDLVAVQNGCSVTVTAEWSDEGEYVLGAMVVPQGDVETSYQEVHGTRLLTLEVRGYVGMKTLFILEAYNQATNKVDETKEVTVDCPAGAVYTTPGYHFVNGREWRTDCEKYSQTMRCRTEIWSTQVVFVGGKFAVKTDWHFNNLTYLPSQRSLWANNPLGGYGKVGYKGEWKSSTHKWRVECDTAVSGKNGCRAYVWASFVVLNKETKQFENTQDWVFNNIVMFS